MARNLSEEKLRELSERKYIAEIARDYGLKPQALRYRATKLGIKSNKPMMAEWNIKYSLALRKKVISLFKNHTAREVAKILGLSHGQIIGIMETNRRMGLVAGDFKDKRNRTPWGAKDWIFTAQRLGIRPRSYIGKRLGRGKARVIKERLRSINAASKYLNGMPRKWAVELWGEETVPKGYKTDAGPSGQRGNFHFVLLPWPECMELSLRYQTPLNIKSAIRAMSRFQLWIHGAKSNRDLDKKLRRILNEK